MKRGPNRKKDCELIACWIPRTMVKQIDERVREEDTDRSKWIRGAIRRQFDSMGIQISHLSSQRAAVIAVSAVIASLAWSAHAPGSADAVNTMPAVVSSFE